MLADLPASIFNKWHTHYIAEPWGYEVEMYRHSEICTYLVNGFFSPKTPVKPSDFYPVKATTINHDNDDVEIVNEDNDELDDDDCISDDKLMQILQGITR